MDCGRKAEHKTPHRRGEDMEALIQYEGSWTLWERAQMNQEKGKKSDAELSSFSPNNPLSGPHCTEKHCSSVRLFLPTMSSSLSTHIAREESVTHTHLPSEEET